MNAECPHRHPECTRNERGMHTYICNAKVPLSSSLTIAIVVGGNRFAYDTLRMHADVSKVIPKMNCFRDIFGRVIAEFLQNVFCFEKRWLWLLSASVLNNSQHKVFHDKCFFFLKQNPTHPDHKSFYYPMISLGIVKTKIFSFVVQESS